MWDLKKNFALIELLERVLSNESKADPAPSSSSNISSPSSAASHGDSASAVCCDENEDHVAVLYCTTCGSHLCQACSESSHATRTLAKHRRIPLSEKPREKYKCSNHTMQVNIRIFSHFNVKQITFAILQVLEFVCLEPECQKSCPLMCYVCKDYGRHKGHKYSLMENEADRMRCLIADAVSHLRKFMEEITETSRKLG